MARQNANLTTIAASARGFTLIEIAVALFIVTLVLGSILVPISTQVERRKISDTQKAMDEIKNALMGFAVANRYLPCPAKSATDGSEDSDRAVPGVCTGNRRQGFIPWATLGVPKLDGWGHIFRYSVTLAYTSSATATLFTLTTARDISIKTRDATGALINLTNSSPPDIPAVVLSHGKNGYGGFDDNGIPQAPPPVANADEITNLAVAGNVFVSRVPQGAAAAGTGGEFDDIVDWLSPNILYNRMVAAGKLP